MISISQSQYLPHLIKPWRDPLNDRSRALSIVFGKRASFYHKENALKKHISENTSLIFAYESTFLKTVLTPVTYITYLQISLSAL